MAPIDVLPNELMMQVLETFPTRSLLPLAAVSSRFQDLVASVHYARLVEAAALQDHELILECYHPSAKISTPYLFCEYLGTDGLAACGGGGDGEPTLRAMAELYSRFRPVLGEENRRPRARYPTQAVLDGRDEALPAELATHDVYLDSDELFSQLCTTVNLVKVGPRRGLFLSSVNVVEGVMRVWRDWLVRESADQQAALRNTAAAAGKGPGDSSILWADPYKTVGLRLRVVETDGVRNPVLLGPGEEPPLSYTLEYDELLIRTNQLLINMEKSEAQQVSHSGTNTTIFMPCVVDYTPPAVSRPEFQALHHALPVSPVW